MKLLFLLFFFATVTYNPVSRATGTAGGERGGDWVGQNVILWDDDIPILWDDDVVITFDGVA